MGIRTFTLSELEAFFAGGKINAAFLNELRHISIDLRDRPHVAAKRKVTMTVSFEPLMDLETKELAAAKIKFNFKHAIPDRESQEFHMEVNDDNDFVYSSEAPDNPAQKTFFDGEVPSNTELPSIAGKVESDAG